MEIIVWKPVKNYEDYYEINNLGQVRSKRKKDYIMEQRIDRGGYYTVRLSRPNKLSSTQYVHRLLAFAFIPNPEDKCCINHLNGNKFDNSLSNLTWATYSENRQHAVDTGLSKGKRPVIDLNDFTYYKCIKTAAREKAIDYETLQRFLREPEINTSTLSYFYPYHTPLLFLRNLLPYYLLNTDVHQTKSAQSYLF